jgi:hypothetical protein
MPLAPPSELAAIYAPGPAEDRSIRQTIVTLLPSYEQGSSMYFAPVAARVNSFLQALTEQAHAATAAIIDAGTFLDLLPVGVPDPAVIVEDDGQIGLDWRVGDNSLSLNLGKNGMIGYASLFGAESAYGRAPFSGTEIPPRIASLLRRLAEQRQGD